MNEYIERARELARKFGACTRAKVGCVIVNNAAPEITGEGVNGGEPCSFAEHLMHEGHCVRHAHAEVEAAISYSIAWGSLSNGADRHATAYCTHTPCPACLHALGCAGVVKVVILNRYRPAEALAEIAKAWQMEIEYAHLT